LDLQGVALSFCQFLCDIKTVDVESSVNNKGQFSNVTFYILIPDKNMLTVFISQKYLEGGAEEYQVDPYISLVNCNP
jgi:hypothetical protein